ncbi:MAG TPA: hypothetical protein VMW07_03995 [Gallionella sp.]|jgi:hypothetical protein|nr:hypothetical protein [Gallionella sp.]
MGLTDKILGPKSKYDKSLPYTYEARVRIFEGSEEHNSYLADTICGLVEHLHRNGIKPDEVQIVEVYQEQEFPIDVKRFARSGQQWLFKPDLCRAFEDHYQGHIQAGTCSFSDRDFKGNGP